MFEIATFGDWSVVQVAAKVSPAASYLFFYTYRFLMALVILPIMSSFIIQAFVTRSDAYNSASIASTPDEVDEDDDIDKAKVIQRVKDANMDTSMDRHTLSKFPHIDINADGENEVELTTIYGQAKDLPPPSMNGENSMMMSIFGNIEDYKEEWEKSAEVNSKSSISAVNSTMIPCPASETRESNFILNQSLVADTSNLRRSRVFEDISPMQQLRRDSSFAREDSSLSRRRKSHSDSITSSNFVPMSASEFELSQSSKEESDEQPSALPPSSALSVMSIPPPNTRSPLVAATNKRKSTTARRGSTTARRTSIVGAKAKTGDVAGSSMISFWSTSGTERLDGPKKIKPIVTDNQHSLEFLQKKLNTTQEELSVQKKVNENLNAELSALKNTLALLQGNLSLDD